MGKSRIIPLTTSILALVGCVMGIPAFAADVGTVIPTKAAKADTSSPFDLRVQYTAEAWDVAQSPMKSGTSFMNALNISLNVDAEKLLGWTGGRFYAEGVYYSGTSVFGMAGTWQATSAIEVLGYSSAVRLYQAYYDQRFGGTDILVGIYDIQQHFGNLKPQEIFFSKGFASTATTVLAGLGQGDSFLGMYPFSTVGLRVKQKLADDWAVQIAVNNGLPYGKIEGHDHEIAFSKQYGAMVTGEIDYTPAARTKLMAGFWTYTGEFNAQSELNPDFTPKVVTGTYGGYIGGATRLYTIEGHRGIDGFVNVGAAEGRVNMATHSVSTGFTVTGLFASRPDDKFGIAASVAGFGEPYMEAWRSRGYTPQKYETVFETTYRARLNDWLVVQPNIQYIHNPNFMNRNYTKDTIVVGLHLEMALDFQALKH